MIKIQKMVAIGGQKLSFPKPGHGRIHLNVIDISHVGSQFEGAEVCLDDGIYYFKLADGYKFFLSDIGQYMCEALEEKKVEEKKPVEIKPVPVPKEQRNRGRGRPRERSA